MLHMKRLVFNIIFHNHVWLMLMHFNYQSESWNSSDVKHILLYNWYCHIFPWIPLVNGSWMCGILTNVYNEQTCHVVIRSLLVPVCQTIILLASVSGSSRYMWPGYDFCYVCIFSDRILIFINQYMDSGPQATLRTLHFSKYSCLS